MKHRHLTRDSPSFFTLIPNTQYRTSLPSSVFIEVRQPHLWLNSSIEHGNSFKLQKRKKNNNTRQHETGLHKQTKVRSIPYCLKYQVLLVCFNRLKVRWHQSQESYRSEEALRNQKCPGLWWLRCQISHHFGAGGSNKARKSMNIHYAVCIFAGLIRFWSHVWSQ